MVRVPQLNTSLTTKSATMVQMFAKMANAKVPSALSMVSINARVLKWIICVKCVVTIQW